MSDTNNSLTVVTAARAAYHAGCAILPVKTDGSKAPAVARWRQYTKTRPTQEECREWFVTREAAGFGVIAGEVSGHLAILDFDGADIFCAVQARAAEWDLAALFATVCGGFLDATPGGGQRLLVRYPPSWPWRDQILAAQPSATSEKSRNTLIELCLFNVMAPSTGATHPTGRSYRRVSGDFDTIQTVDLEQLEDLLALFRSFDEMPKPAWEARHTSASKPGTGRRPGDDFNQRTDWHDLLEPLQWKVYRQVGDRTYWTRPGKKTGVSATTFDDSGLLWVFTSSTELEPEHSYSKFAVYTVAHHAGDFHAAAKMLYAEGYGGHVIDLGPDVVDITDEGGDMSDADAPVVEPTAPAPAAAPPPAFEIVTVPESFVSKFIRHVELRTDAPLEAAELVALAVLSALVGPDVTIPFAMRPRDMSLVLWAMFLVDSTTGRKTTLLDFARDILETVISRTCLVEWEGSPQGLIQRLMERDGKATVFLRDEYSGLLAQMNRGGHVAGLEQTFIRAFDGRVLENIRTRKKNKKTGDWQSDTDRVENPYLVKLTAATATNFMSKATLDNVLDGFLTRFIFVTTHATPRRPKRLDESMKEAHVALLEHARQLYDRGRQGAQLEISTAVLDEWWELEQAWRQRAEAAPRPDAAAPTFKRLGDATIKVAGLLAFDDLTANRIVEPRHFKAARRMGERWVAHAALVLESLGASTFQKDCDQVAASVPKRGSIPLSNLYRAHRRLRKKDLDEVLQALSIQERIVMEAETPGKKRGRPVTNIKKGPQT